MHAAFPLSHCAGHLQDFTVLHTPSRLTLYLFLFWRPVQGSLPFPFKFTFVDQTFPGKDRIIFFPATVKVYTFEISNTVKWSLRIDLLNIVKSRDSIFSSVRYIFLSSRHVLLFQIQSLFSSATHTKKITVVYSYMIPEGSNSLYSSGVFLILFAITIFKIKFSSLTGKFSLHFEVLGFLYKLCAHMPIRFILAAEIKNQNILKVFSPTRV